MDVEGSATTLAGRQETHGRKYPILLEKLVFLITITVAIMAGQWIWTESDWSTVALWPALICGLPLTTLFVAEMLGRAIQRIHIGNE